MKKLAILLLAFVLVCSCFVLAACGDGEDTSSPAADNSSAADTSSKTETSSKEETSSEASVEESSEASVEESSDVPDESSEESTDEPVAAESKPLWLTHYDTLENEGSGVVLSKEYTGGAWWIHVSFKPVDGEDGVYEIVEIKDGLAEGSGGSGAPLEIPTGGFVYALNSGNDYPSLGDSKPDYTSQACADMLAAMRTWKVGDKFTFTGVDFENFTDVPTSTPGVQWYEDGDYDYGNYVCTATFTKVG